MKRCVLPRLSGSPASACGAAAERNRIRRLVEKKESLVALSGRKQGDMSSGRKETWAGEVIESLGSRLGVGFSTNTWRAGGTGRGRGGSGYCSRRGDSGKKG